MQEIKGKFRSLIFNSNSGYKVGLFKVKSASADLEDIVNKTITFSGYFSELNSEEEYTFFGEYVNHPKYGYQFNTNKYEKIKPEGKDSIIEFLSSSLIKGCGEKTATKIVNTLGEDAINKIKADKGNLLLVPGITEKKADDIYTSLLKYGESDQILLDLTEMGFSIKESLKMFKAYGSFIINMINDNIFQLIDLIEFYKLDQIFLMTHEVDVPLRIKACIIEGLKRLSFNLGDTYSTKEEIYLILKKEFGLDLPAEELSSYLNDLNGDEIVIEDDKYYLNINYEMETYIAESLKKINDKLVAKTTKFNELIKKVEEENNVIYNDEQKKAIKESLNNNICIITGGPGTGKTTIVNGLVKMLKEVNNWHKETDINKIALLAPTGRASKKLAESTKSGASTMHRYLKWNKEENTFGYNEDNTHQPEVVIIDETSMVDTFLFYHLLKGIDHNAKFIFVGDENQLPSVGAGLILSDLIMSESFNHVSLNKIYRQSENSYIPYLAKEIKDLSLSEEFFSSQDDFKFFETQNHQVKDVIKQICDLSLNKSMTSEDIQILAPMYKGENGIDNLNILLQEHFNSKKLGKKELKYGDLVYRENDKVIQLVNDPDNNVYNGDIGYIEKINQEPNKILEVNFEGTIVNYKRDELNSLKHAYAISIHKSQGSEFNHVIMPITMNYSRMLYNKLIYTGITRAKKSLIVVGSYEAMKKGVLNNYSEDRKTTLKDKIKNTYK